MKKLLFYISIFILCILIWLNIHNKEGIDDAANHFKTMTADNLLDIYKVMNGMTVYTDTKVSAVTAPVDEATKKITETTEKITETTTAITSSITFEDDAYEEEPPPPPPQQSQSCPTKEEVIKQLKELDINDREFIDIINIEPVDKAYDQLYKILKLIPTVIYKQSYRKRGHRTNSQIPRNIWDPKCTCLSDSNMCKNYTFLDPVLQDIDDNFNHNLIILNAPVFGDNTVIRSGGTLGGGPSIDLNSLKFNLREFFKLTHSIG
jgi:hypothetical protein